MSGIAVGRAGRDAGRVGLDAEEKLRAHQHGAQGHLDPGVEVPFCAGTRYSSIGLFEVSVGDRPAVRPAHERGENSRRRTPPRRPVPSAGKRRSGGGWASRRVPARQ